jgi:hypothetical protein
VAEHLLAIFTGIISGLAYAAYSLMGRKAANRGLNAWTTILYTFAFAPASCWFSTCCWENLCPGPPVNRLTCSGWVMPGGVGVLLLLAAGPTVAGFGLYNVSLGICLQCGQPDPFDGAGIHCHYCLPSSGRADDRHPGRRQSAGAGGVAIKRV